MEINLVAVGIILVVIGFIVIILGSAGSKDVKFGFGGFIGPIPFGWANDPQMLKWVIAITAILAIVFIIFLLRGV